MCGIVGYFGHKPAAPILLEGLSKLEYRGYDSAGIAVRNDKNEEIEVVKAKGRLKGLSEKTDGGKSVPGSSGIGHTRWATHGEPSENNAHPHVSNSGEVTLVHNGIIENYAQLKEKLAKKGYTFHSQTDTEVAANLVDYYLGKEGGDPVAAIAHAMLRIRGSYAFGIMFKDHPECIYAARKDSPLIVGKSDNGSLIASDVPAILSETRKVYYIDNMEIARLDAENITFYNIDKEVIEKPLVEIKWDAEAAEKGGFPHFMMKEIHEQPKAVKDTINAYLKDGKIDLSETGLTDEEIKGFERVYVVACGSAYHVGVVGKYVIEDMVHIPVEIDIASEFRYRNPRLSKNSLVVIISQSGETADSLAALRLSKEMGVKTLAIVNVIGSSIAREADHVMYTYAGPEIAVATTKAYSAQLIAMYILAMKFGLVKGTVNEGSCADCGAKELEEQIANNSGSADEKPSKKSKKAKKEEKSLIPEENVYFYDNLVTELTALPDKIAKILEDKERIQWFAAKFANAQDIFFIGRGIDYAISLEGSLKCKEISYIHSEAYAAGELKHGTISLIEDGTLVIGVLTQNDLFEKTRSNMVEVKSRGAYLMGLTSYGNYSVEDTADFTAYIPKTAECFAASLAVVPLQLLGYYISVAKGLDVDKPRNLAKSVTVE